MPVVLDPMHGCNVHHARRYLQAVFPRSLFSAIHDTPDPMFGGHPPDSSHGEFLDELSAPWITSGPRWASLSTATAIGSRLSTTRA